MDQADLLNIYVASLKALQANVLNFRAIHFIYTQSLSDATFILDNDIVAHIKGLDSKILKHIRDVSK